MQTNSDKTESWDVNEEIFAGYAQLNLKGKLFGFPFTVNVGLRAEYTDLTSRGTQLENGASTGFVAELIPFSVKNYFSDYLPSLNLSLHLSDEQIVRFAASKAIARAPLNDLNAGFGLYTFKAFPEAFGGNPRLKPWKSKQYDLTYEHYFTADQALAVSLFYKYGSSAKSVGKIA